MKAPILLAGVAVAVLVGLAWAADPPKPVDWQKRADEARWDFDHLPRDLRQSLDRADRTTYALRTVPVRDADGRPDGFVVRVLKNDKLAHEFAAHAGTTFVVSGDRLYRSVHQTGSSGAEVVGVDLARGGELWQVRLRGLGPVQHSAYRNQVALRVADGAVWAFGHESLGGYVEILDPDTGRTLGHRTLTARNPEPIRETENTLYLHDWAAPRKAALADLAWLAGRYEGRAYGGNPCQLTFAAPLADGMTGMFAYSQGGKLAYREFFTVAEKGGTLVLRVRSFDDELRSPEPDPEHAAKRLVKVEPGAAYFNGRTFRKGENGELKVFVAARNPDGSAREDRYTFSRVADGR